MAYKQTPGRGNGKKTGAGISPMLMSGSAMYQIGDVEYTGQGRMKVKETQARIKKDPKKTAEYDSNMGLTRNPATNELSGKPYEKKYIPGQNELVRDKIVDGAGKLVSESGKGPAAKREFKKQYDRLKSITESQRKDSSEGLNAFQGNTKPENLNERQKKSMINSTRAKLIETPAKQMSKLKSSKSPAKQVSKMPAEKASKDKGLTNTGLSPRVKREKAAETMERNKGGAEPTSRKAPMSGGRSLEKNGTREMPKASKKAPMKMKKC